MEEKGARGRNAASLRATNLALVMQEIVARPGKVTRAEVAARLRSTRSTVSRLVDELIEGGLVVEGATQPGARGRPGVPLSPASGGPCALGIEINVDRYVLTVADLAGAVLAERSVSSDQGALDPADALELVGRDAAALCRGLPNGARLVGAHLAIPGLVDRDGETILRAPNLKWDGIRPRDHLSGLLDPLGLGFRVGNDVDASARTVVQELGGAHPSLVYVTGEVGIGAAISLDGQLMAGRHGWASELGHVCVDPAGRVCGCGARGCLEAVAGVPAVLAASGCVGLAELEARLADGDQVALGTLAEVGRALGQALAAALNLLDVATVVLGGYLGSCLPWLRQALEEELAARVLWSPYSAIEVIAVGDAPLRTARGAALAALSSLVGDPARWLDAPAASPAN